MLAPFLIDELIGYRFPIYPTVTGLPQPITFTSLCAFVYSFTWTGLVLVALNGWGKLTARLFRIQQFPASVSCSLGIASIFFLGGWLNLFHAIYSFVLFGLIGIGALLFIFLRKTRPASYRWYSFWSYASPTARTLVLLALIILSCRAAGTVRPAMLNSLDDTTAYLAFPHKMLALHSFAADQFSDRRVTSALGGSYFLQTFVIAGTSLANTAMADRTFGLILLAVTLFDLGVAFEISTFQIALLGFLAFLVPQESMNLTFIMLPPVLLLGMLWMAIETFREDHFNPWKLAFLAGAIGGAVILLKSTYLPIVGAFALVPYSMLSIHTKRGRWLNFSMLAGLGSLVVVGAWMVAMKLTSGTYLFPILGHGFDYSSYGQFPSTSNFHSARAFIKIFLQGFALLFLAGCQFFTSKLKSRKDQFSFWVLIASAAAITAFNYKSGGDSIWRYNFPQFFSAILVFYAATASTYRSEPRLSVTRAGHYIGILAMLGMIFYYDVAGKNPRPFRDMTAEWNDYKPALRASLSGLALASPTEQHRYEAIEASLPANAVALENTAYPYLFDNRGRTIFIADWPAAASLPPGWPFPENIAGLVSYFRHHSIRFVIYDYKYARWTDAEGCEALVSPNLNSQWIRDQWHMNVLAHDQFNHLLENYRRTYDDGGIAVIDLDRPLPDAPPNNTVWSLATDKDAMCSEVMARYLANPPIASAPQM